MKNILTTLAIIFSVAAFGQTSEEYLKSGLEKHKLHDFEGAIKDYNKAIKTDNNNKDAYFNRGTCELALKEHKEALADFTKTIELDPKFVKAYYSRATTYASQEKYVEALPDLDKTIELEQDFPSALTLRGQIRVQSGNKKGGCEDFAKAKEYGDKSADKYIEQFCGTDKSEEIIINWPESEKWKIGSSQDNDKMTMIEYIHSDETFDNWTELGTMFTFKGMKLKKIDDVTSWIFDEFKKNSPKAKLTVIEKDDKAEYPWIIFTIEAKDFIESKIPESDLYYATQGKISLYTNFRAVKQTTVPKDLKEKWIKFFKQTKVVQK